MELLNSKLQCCCLTFTGDTEKCTDLSKHCSHWVSKKECTTRPDYMAQNCKKSCEMCGPGKFFFYKVPLTIQGPTNLLNSLVYFLPFDRLEIAEKLYFVLFLMFSLVSVLVVRFLHLYCTPFRILFWLLSERITTWKKRVQLKVVLVYVKVRETHLERVVFYHCTLVVVRISLVRVSAFTVINDLFNPFHKCNSFSFFPFFF